MCEFPSLCDFAISFRTVFHLSSDSNGFMCLNQGKEALLDMLVLFLHFGPVYNCAWVFGGNIVVVLIY